MPKSDVRHRNKTGDSRTETTEEDKQMCEHRPTCPEASACDHDAARIVASHPEQGWHLLCNGVLLFDDSGELLPDGQALAPRRVAPPSRSAA
jgi:Family of unknown function (DUF5999)